MKRTHEKAYVRYIAARDLRDYIGDLEKIGDVILQIEQVAGKPGGPEGFLLEGVRGKDYDQTTVKGQLRKAQAEIRKLRKENAALKAAEGKGKRS